MSETNGSDSATISSALHDAGAELRAARRQLDRAGASAVQIARGSLERAVALLACAATDEDLCLDVRDAALGCRVVVSSHLLAAGDFEAVGLDRATVASLLYRATDPAPLDAAIRASQAHANRSREPVVHLGPCTRDALARAPGSA
jgi:hypothetical protein